METEDGGQVVAKSRLWVVMPVYNEESCLAAVVQEWVPALRRELTDFTFCILDDGSTDTSREVAKSLRDSDYPELHVVSKANSGHGQTCVLGYRLAMEAGADWVFQIDSDGQCDPRFFPDFWSQRHDAPAVYGFRRRRLDGWRRVAVSGVLRLVVLATTGVWVRDSNVPYRLMRADTLVDTLPSIPGDFHLANILLAVLQQRAFGIRWRDIVFRDRFGDRPSGAGLSFFAGRGLQLATQLRAAVKTGSSPRPR